MVAKRHSHTTIAGHCFERSYAFVRQDPFRYKYVEGLAVNPLCAMLHAWVLDTEDNRVVDLCWFQDFYDLYSYFGVAYEFDEIRKIFATNGYYGIFARQGIELINFG